MTGEDGIQIPRLIFYDPSELIDYFSPDNLVLLTDVLDGINFAYENELDEIDLFEVKFAISKDIMVFNLTRDKWIEQLELLINSFAKLEEYEYAQKTKELIEKLKKEV